MLLYSAQVKVRRLLGMGRSAGRGGAPRDTHARAGVLRTPTASRRGRPDCSEPRPGVHLCTRGGVTRSRRPALPPARALTLVHECLSSSTPERGARPLQRRRRTDGRGLESQRLRGARREIGAQRPGHSAGATGARGARNDGDVVLARNAPEEDRTRGTLIRELPCWRERGDRITRRGCTGVASALSAPWRAATEETFHARRRARRPAFGRSRQAAIRGVPHAALAALPRATRIPLGEPRRGSANCA